MESSRTRRHRSEATGLLQREGCFWNPVERRLIFIDILLSPSSTISKLPTTGDNRMTSKSGTSKSRKGIRGFLHDTFSRSSSQLSAPSTLAPGSANRASFSSLAGPPSSLGQGQLLDVPSTSEQPVRPRLLSTPGSTSTEPRTNPPPNLGSGSTTVTNVVWSGLKSSLQGLKDSSALFPHLSAAAGILLECFDGVETAARNQQDYEDLARELGVLSESLADLVKAPTPMTKSISNVAIGIEEQAKQIKEKMGRGAAGNFLAAEADEADVVRRYRQIQSLFRQLQANLSVSAWSIANQHLVNTQLESLNPVKEATYDSKLSTAVNRRKCTEGTRAQVLSDLHKWLYDRDAPTVYWMNGMAGTGKTTIACTFSQRLEARELLAASFFCTRTSADCRDITRIVPSIAYQLARYSIPFQSALHAVLDKEPDVGSKNTEKQFERLLRDPLEKSKDAMPDNLVVVIDALDECEDRNGVEILLDMLFQYAPQIPLKFFLTSRPEPEIYGKMSLHSQARDIVHLHEIEKSLVQADIEMYLQAELSFMGPSPSDIEQLVQRSGALFIFAATLVRYIQSGKRLADPQKRLRSVLNMTPEATKQHTQIDALYTAILKSALNQDEMEADETEDVRAVLRTVLFVQEPVSIDTIAALAGIEDPQRVLAALQPLRSVLHQSEQTGLISTLHASFPDFMSNSERSGEYFCDIVEHSQALAERCFLTMKRKLRFNICALESSFIPDDKADDIQERVKEKISPTLAYACRYWANHLASASKSDTLLKMLEEFISDRLLFWMEVLCLRREMTVGITTLLKAKQCLNQAGPISSLLVNLVEDARNFVTGVASSPVSQSTPHIYVSSLPFCPRSSSVYKNYWKRTRGLLELEGSLMERREGAALATWNIGSSVNSVAYSPDGTRVAVGCGDRTVRILNAHDGTPLFDPLKGHTGTVLSVAFSPDGKLVASGSYDHTIRIWNAYNGSLVLGPLQGHSNTVRSVSYSPDGTRIVSGSYDDTIRIWSTSDGALLLGPLRNDYDDVNSVAFSPDGTLIASGSDDHTVRLWKSHDGTPAAPPFEGHTDLVRSVAFTPDGTRLVSGSDDRTIRVWNISDGSLVVSPLEGHTGIVHSVAVSPDGMRVASGSSDVTIRTWKIEDGTLAAGPFIGHIDSILSVTYSPDGTRVISGSEDGTIRVWNVRDGLIPPTPFRSHILGLTSVSASSQCTRIFSASSDGIVWAWGISSEEVVPNLLEGRFARSLFPRLSLAGGNVAFCAEDHSIWVLKADDLSPVAGPLIGHSDYLSASGFSEDATHLATGSSDCTIRVWNLRKGELTAGPLHGHGGEVTSVALSWDYSRAISCAIDDKTIRVWNTRGPVIHVTSPHDLSPSSTPEHSHSNVLESWKIQEDGWVTNGNSDLLFLIPHDLRQGHVWPSPHTEFVVSKDGVLHIPQQELRIGDEWSKCYVSD